MPVTMTHPSRPTTETPTPAIATTATCLSRLCTLELRVLAEAQWPVDDPLGTPELLAHWGLNRQPQECVWVIAYDAVMHLRTVVEVSRGDYISAGMHLPTILSAVLTAGAERFVLAHNHPTGDPTPTEPDVRSTAMVMEAANAVGLSLEDHWIVTPTGRSASMVGMGLMPQPDYPAQGTFQGAP